MNFLASKNAPRFSTLFWVVLSVRSWLPWKRLYFGGFFEVFGFDFDSEQIRFLGGHPFVCGWRSYYQQGFKQT
ncbi:hypothetical protein [Tunturiibacter gelidoferens]|jgi:hypothetical protein|uniref:Uncharacterized protein n=1 Tax=Tunturiibacter gelidiferens TaxID=3069689 RepID=A0A9X0QBS6_9BACT|nr:hypothetical protein [Edaphobacter lichenicola]MBB5327328.1 hypothetical protein [Edaphobacter lichenicola]